MGLLHKITLEKIEKDPDIIYKKFTANDLLDLEVNDVMMKGGTFEQSSNKFFRLKLVEEVEDAEEREFLYFKNYHHTVELVEIDKKDYNKYMWSPMSILKLITIKPWRGEDGKLTLPSLYEHMKAEMTFLGRIVVKRDVVMKDKLLKKEYLLVKKVHEVSNISIDRISDKF
jgi:hypothetical protein